MSTSTAIAFNTMPDYFTILLFYCMKVMTRRATSTLCILDTTYLIQEFKALKIRKIYREEVQQSLHKFLSQRQLVLNSSQKVLHFSKFSGKCASTISAYGKWVLLKNLLGSLHDMSGLFMHLATTACAGKNWLLLPPPSVSPSASLWQTLS